MATEFMLAGLPADNPLGFMAALGALVTARDAWPRAEELDEVRLAWKPAMGGWRPVLRVPGQLTEDELVVFLHKSLHRVVDPAAQELAHVAHREQRTRATELGVAIDRYKALGRRVPRLEKQAFQDSQVAPVRAGLAVAAAAYRRALAGGGAADPLLALGAHPKQVPADAFAEAAGAWAAEASAGDRRLVDLVAALGSEAVLAKDGNLDPTQLSKANGSGNQFLLKDAGELMISLSASRLRAALLAPWDYSDKRLTLGWNPYEVQERALLANDPGKTGSHTMHGANRLAFEALALFPAVPDGRRLATTGNARIGKTRCFTWPIWRASLAEGAVRTVLALSVLQQPVPDREWLGRLGIVDVFRAEHFTQYGSYPRFRPARSV
jgi:hypothetical protein